MLKGKIHNEEDNFQRLGKAPDRLCFAEKTSGIIPDVNPQLPLCSPRSDSLASRVLLFL
jgi:hypothetical protein